MLSKCNRVDHGAAAEGHWGEGMNSISRLVWVTRVAFCLLLATSRANATDDWISGLWVGQVQEKQIDAEMRIRGLRSDGSFGVSLALLGLAAESGRGTIGDATVAVSFADGGMTFRRQADALAGIFTAANGAVVHMKFHRISPDWDHVTGGKDCDLEISQFSHPNANSWVHLRSGQSTLQRVTGDSLFCSNGFIVQIPP